MATHDSVATATINDLSEEYRHADVEWRKSRKSLLYYLKTYVKIQSRAQQAIINWEDWPHLVELVDTIQDWLWSPIPRTPMYLLVFKSRQVGLSTVLAGIADYICKFFESSKVLELSKREQDADDLLAKSKFINSQQPDWLRINLDPDQTSKIGYPATHGEVQSYPSTMTAGRSTDATVVICDEWEFHPYAEENFGAVKPTIDAGGLFIGVSTVDKREMDSFPKKKYHEWQDNDLDNYKTFFFDYFVVPTRTEEDWENDTEGMPEWQREAEYPRSEKEALAAPRSTSFFDRATLDRMLNEVYSPVDEYYDNKIRIYEQPALERRYMFAVDPSEGAVDPSVGVIGDSQSTVASFSGRMGLDEQAKLIRELYFMYNEPYLAIERNASGLSLINKLLETDDIKNWHHYDDKHDKPGWWTGGNQWASGRLQMLNELEEAIRMGWLRIPIKEAIEEFYWFSWNQHGKPEAVKGKHDDWVMAHAILYQLRKFVKSKGTARIQSFKYKERA